MTKAKLTKGLGIGAILAVIFGSGVAGLEFWRAEPEPCAVTIVRIGDFDPDKPPARCKHPQHVPNHIWSSDFSVVHLHCICPQVPRDIKQD